MFRRRRKGGGRKSLSSGRTCPFCETLNPDDAVQCHQCYYELDKKAKDQGRATSEVPNETLWGELMREVSPEEMEEDLVYGVHSIDEMTQEIDEYETIGDDEVIIMSEDGPSFEEILEASMQVEEDRREEVLMSVSAPTVAETPSSPTVPAVEIPERAQEPSITTVATPPLPTLTPPSLPTIGGVTSESDLDDDLDEIIAAATTSETKVSTPPPSIPNISQVNGAVAPPALPNITQEPVTPPTPAPVVETSVLLPTSPPPTPSNGASIWPWPQAEPWDQRDLRREIIEAMEHSGRGDKVAAGAALDRLGPHLGERFEALHHIGALLHSLGRGDEMRRMVEAARLQHPDDPNVSTAAAALLQS